MDDKNEVTVILPAGFIPGIVKERAALRAEVERLTGELSSLRGVCDGACADIATQQEIIGNMANRLGDKQAEVEQLRDLWRNVTMRCQEREQEIERLRAALEWYADPANYGRGGCPGNLQLGETWATREVMIWKRDNGQRAREALRRIASMREGSR